MGDRIKRTSDNKRITERFFKVPVVKGGKPSATCKVCGWPASESVGGEHYCATHRPAEKP